MWFKNSRKHIFRSETDEFLCKNISSKNQDIILSELYSRYAYLVYGVCMKYLKNKEDAEDLTLEIFIDLIHKIYKYEPKVFKSWLYVLAKNACLMQLRKSKSYSGETTYDLPSEEISNEKEIQDNILDNLLPNAVTHLKQEQKICIELFYLKSMSYQDIASQTGFTISSVKSHIQNGKRNLKIILEKMTKNES